MSYPENYFTPPLDIPIVLAGTFGELRSAHFHSGIDLKTQQKEGLNVYTSAEGYVSRIKVSNWGYGKAVYIDHPNGYTTVYAHLNKFNDKIEKYLRTYQYKKEKEEIQLFPKKGEIPIKTGEILGYSGSTGGFIAPHLHFEIRDTKTEKIINPMHFGIKPKDTKNPIINSLRAYALNDSSHVNLSKIAIPIPIKRLNSENYIAEKTQAFGSIGFSINTYDQQDGAINKNGIYKLEMFINGKKTFEHKVETFSFSESKYINLLIDYPFFGEHKRKYQKTFIHPENKLDTYDRRLGDGTARIKAKQNYNIRIKATDFAGNHCELTIPVLGINKPPKTKQTILETSFYVEKNQPKKIKLSGVDISFLKNTFYDNTFLDIQLKDSILKIHKPVLPLHKSYTISFDVSNFSKKQKEHLYIAQIVNKKYYNYCQTNKSDSIFKTNTKSLGNFKLHTDNEAPQIDKCSFHENQELKNPSSFSIRVMDELSGLKKYRGEIDEKWIRLELNVKTNILTFDFNDIELKKGKHSFTLIAMDNAGNTRTFTTLFFIK